MNQQISDALYGHNECRPVIRRAVVPRMFSNSEAAAFCAVSQGKFNRMRRLRQHSAQGKPGLRGLEYTHAELLVAREQLRSVSRGASRVPQ